MTADPVAGQPNTSLGDAAERTDARRPDDLGYQIGIRVIHVVEARPEQFAGHRFERIGDRMNVAPGVGVERQASAGVAGRAEILADVVLVEQAVSVTDLSAARRVRVDAEARRIVGFA